MRGNLTELRAPFVFDCALAAWRLARVAVSHDVRRDQVVPATRDAHLDDVDLHISGLLGQLGDLVLGLDPAGELAQLVAVCVAQEDQAAGPRQARPAVDAQPRGEPGAPAVATATDKPVAAAADRAGARARLAVVQSGPDQVRVRIADVGRRDV